MRSSARGVSRGPLVQRVTGIPRSGAGAWHRKSREAETVEKGRKSRLNT